MGWQIVVTVILGVTIVANIVVMRIASSDPAFAIEPDYYKKAVAFDSTMATERRSLDLGWTATSVFASSDSGGQRTLTVTIVDAQQLPVQGATVTIVALANARANDLLSAALREVSPGHYQSALAARFAGQWEVRIDAVRGGQHFVTSTRANVARAPGPLGPDARPTGNAMSGGASQ
jgi:nitrogen fixation protein FixH